MNPQIPNPNDAEQNPPLQPAPQTIDNTPLPHEPPRADSSELTNQNPFIPQAYPSAGTSGLSQPPGVAPGLPTPPFQPQVTPVAAALDQPTVASPVVPLGQSNAVPLISITAASAAQSGKELERKQLIKKLIIGAAAITVIAVVIGIVLLKLNSGLKLTSKSTTDYSMLVPEGYKEKIGNDVVSYEEPEGGEETRSGVFVFHESYPGGAGLTSQQKDEFFKAAEQIPQTLLATQGVTAKDFKVERTTFKKNDALKFSGRIDDGENSGELKGMFILGDKAFYMVFVAAHKSDPGLIKKTDKIVNSFEINK